MSRKSKNIILTLIILITVVGMGCTMMLAKNSVSSTTNSGKIEMEQGMPGNMGEPPSGNMPNGEMPELPDGENATGERPEMPSGEAPLGETPTQSSESNQTEERPELPNGEATTGENQAGERPEMPNGSNQMGKPSQMNGDFRGQKASENKSLATKYKVIIAIEAIALAIELMILIMTKANKIGIKEALVTGGKGFIFIGLIIILALGISIGAYAVADKFVLNNTSKSTTQMNGGAPMMQNAGPSGNMQKKGSSDSTDNGENTKKEKKMKSTNNTTKTSENTTNNNEV